MSVRVIPVAADGRTRHRAVLVALILGAALAFPLGVVASHQFSDVPNSNPYHADIDALADSGVTTGCGGGKYCPADFVTREQMAAFMNRLGALGAGKTPVVNAAKLDGLDSTDLLGDGPIEILQQGPWQEYLGLNLGLRTSLAWTDVNLTSSGSATIALELRAPGTIGGQQYGLESVQICYGDALDVGITATRAAFGTVNGAVELVVDDTTDQSMATDACYTENASEVVTPTAAVNLFLDLDWVDNTVARIGTVTSTWVATN
jgi:hypothetical protein